MSNEETINALRTRLALLCVVILDWWHEHQYDEVCIGGGDYGNAYDEDPEFVKLAKEYTK